MKTKRVHRYYCDFCKKSGCSAGHMRKHEQRCTMNPGRECGVCKMFDKHVDNYDPVPLTRLVETLPDPDEMIPGESVDLSKLRVLASNCPACILAALRQGGVAEHANFHFALEMRSVWNELNSREAERCHHG